MMPTVYYDIESVNLRYGNEWYHHYLGDALVARGYMLRYSGVKLSRCLLLTLKQFSKILHREMIEKQMWQNVSNESSLPIFQNKKLWREGVGKRERERVRERALLNCSFSRQLPFFKTI
jgi:hypothetical protein